VIAKITLVAAFLFVAGYIVWALCAYNERPREELPEDEEAWKKWL
jgi:hypothetical protein